MIPFYRAVGVFGLAALCACSEDGHALDRHLAKLSSVTVTKLPDMGWPAGTQFCPMTNYQSQLPTSEPLAERVNAYLAAKKFVGDEGHWSLIVVKPTPSGDSGIEQFLFKSENYALYNEPEMVARDAETVPAEFEMKTCMPIEQTRVLATRMQKTHRTIIIFGMDKKT